MNEIFHCLLNGAPLATFAYTAVVVATTAISAGVSIYSANQAADQAEDAAASRAAADRQRANEEAKVAAENARRREQEAARMAAQQRAALAAGGLAMEGTPLAVLGDNYLEAQRQVQDLAYEAKRKQKALRYGAQLSLVEGQQQGDALRLQGYGKAIGAVSSGVTGYLS